MTVLHPVDMETEPLTSIDIGTKPLTTINLGSYRYAKPLRPSHFCFS